MPANRLANRRPVTGQHIHHPTWQPGGAGQFGNAQRGQRGFHRRFDNHRTASRQRRANLPGQHQKREIPRQNKAHNTNRLTHKQCHMIIGRRADLIINFINRLGMPFQAMDGFRNINSGTIINGFAAIKAFQNRKFMAVAQQQLAEPNQHIFAGGRVQA